MRTCAFTLGAIALSLPALSAFSANSPRPDLVGHVRHADDSPVANATVFIWTAGPKEGPGILCPSCYVDCGKQGRTDANGAFRIDSLDPKLLFRLLVVAPGHQSVYVPKTDPAAGDVSITLAPLDPAKLAAPTRIRGMVLGPDGQAVPGATIGPEGVSYGMGTRWGGTDAFVDPLAVTDEHGRFWLYCTNGVDQVHAVVEARALAKRWAALEPGADHLIRMEEGVMLTGRIEREGRAVPGVVVGAVTADRTAGNFFRCDELATDEDGRFGLPNMPPDREFIFYAKMDSLGDRGALPPRRFQAGKTGGTVDLGTLPLQPGHRVAGRVVLSDGKPIPPDTRLLLGREQAWDHTEARLGPDGRFAFTGVPEESVSISVRVKAYKFSKRNRSLDWLNGGMVGRVDGDTEDLLILLEPGQWRYNGEEGEPPNGDSQPRDKPLRGAE